MDKRGPAKSDVRKKIVILKVVKHWPQRGCGMSILQHTPRGAGRRPEQPDLTDRLEGTGPGSSQGVPSHPNPL